MSNSNVLSNYNAIIIRPSLCISIERVLIDGGMCVLSYITSPKDTIRSDWEKDKKNFFVIEKELSPYDTDLEAIESYIQSAKVFFAHGKVLPASGHIVVSIDFADNLDDSVTAKELVRLAYKYNCNFISYT